MGWRRKGKWLRVRDDGILKAKISLKIKDSLFLRSASSGSSWEVRRGIANVEIPDCS